MSNSLPLARRMRGMRRSAIREILKIAKRPDIISFAGGLPAPELFPLQAFGEAVRKTLEQDGAASLQYDVTEGYPPLKEFLARWMTGRGLRCGPENILLTSGSQQALDLIGKIFLDPGDTAVVENPTYLGAIQAFDAYQARYRSVPMDDQGMEVDPFRREAGKKGSKLGYLVPTFQNPSGVTMTESRRKEIIRAAHASKLTLVEDDPYGWLRFKGKNPPTLYTTAGGRGVIYLSTFSKILSPGIRLGWVVADPKIVDTLVVVKQAADLQPNSFIQRAAYHYAASGHLDEHIPVITACYKRRAEVMLEAMRAHFPKSIKRVEPEGGMFTWCELPKGISALRIFPKAVAAGVAYVTGSVFHATGGGDNTLRLNFTNSTEDQIREGIKRLGKVFRDVIPA